MRTLLARTTSTEPVEFKPLSLATFYVGLAVAIPRYVDTDVGPLSVAFVVAVVLAVIGWRRASGEKTKHPYMYFAIALGAWIGVAGVAAWKFDAMIEGARFAAWIILIIPGLAILLRERRHRDALLLGWAIGTFVFALTGALRLVEGREIFDLGANGLVTPHEQLLGTNRNGVNMIVLVIVPVLVTRVRGRVMRILRWPLLGLSVLWLVNSGGRTAIGGLAVVALALVAVQPGVASRVIWGARLCLVLAVGISLMQGSEGQARQSTDRLLDLFRGEQTDSDAARGILTRKAWNLALDHPFFGVGFGRFESSYHPVIEDSRNVATRNIVVKNNEHNSYVKVLAESGFPGFLLFIAYLLMLMLTAIRVSRDREVCGILAACGGILFSISFHTALGVVLFVPLALLLSVGLGPIDEQQAVDDGLVEMQMR